MENELEQLGERIAEQAAHLDAAMHRLLADLRAFDARGGWHVQGAASCAHWLAWRVGWDLVTARDHVRVARKLAEFPAIDDALRRGEVSYSKVRAMLRVATAENEVLLLEHAKLMTASQLEKLCRKYALVLRHGQDRHPEVDEQRRYVRRRDTEDGMVKIEAVLHPEEAEMVWAMLDHAAAQLVEPSSRSGGNPADSAESSAAPRQHAALTASLPAPAVLHGSETVACVISDGIAEQITTSPSGDSTESLEEAVPAARSDVGQVSPLPAVSALDGTPDAADFVVSDGVAVATIMSPIGGAAESLDEGRSAARSDVELIDPLFAVSAPDSRRDAGAYVIGDGATRQITSFAIDDSAESMESGAVASTLPLSAVPQRSLLDRLLDEADALRGADVDAHDAVSDLRDAECELGVAGPVQCPPGPANGRREAGSLRDRAAAARRAFNRADALVAMAQGYLRGNRPERAPVEVLLTIPASSLRAGAAVDSVEVGEMGESFLSGETARRLSCDAGIVDVVEDEQGSPLSVGRKRRTIGGALKRALRKRDGMCSFPGCTNHLFLEGHHIKHWADGGETSLQNSTLLCSLHHRYVHEYGYAIELGPDQRPRFRDPHGRWVAAVPERPCVVELGWSQIRAANEALDIDADTIAGPWDGTPVDYGRIVGHLATADRLA
jgi:hypothetical protein